MRLPDWSRADVSEASEVSLTVLFGQTTSARPDAIGRREDAKATIGNFTLLYYGVNRSLQDRESAVKREKFL